MTRALTLITDGYLCIEAVVPIYVGPPQISGGAGAGAGFGQWSPIQKGPWTPPLIIEEEIFYRNDAPIHAAVETGLLLSGDNIFDRIAAMIGEELQIRKKKD